MHMPNTQVANGTGKPASERQCRQRLLIQIIRISKGLIPNIESLEDLLKDAGIDSLRYSSVKDQIKIELKRLEEVARVELEDMKNKVK